MMNRICPGGSSICDRAYKGESRCSERNISKASRQLLYQMEWVTCGEWHAIEGIGVGYVKLGKIAAKGVEMIKVTIVMRTFVSSGMIEYH